MNMLIPALRRRVLEPLWGIYSRAELLEAWDALERSQYLPESVLLERQWASLTEMLRFAYEHNSFHRARFDRAGIDPREIRTIEDFRRLPILTKPEARAAGFGMLSDKFDRASLLGAKTGGSTGTPLELLCTEEVAHLRNASGRRNKRWAGWEVGEPIGAVWGNPRYPSGLWEKVREWVLTPTIYLDTMSITPEAVVAFAQEWERARPTLLFGHAHSLYLLALVVEQNDVHGIEPRAIIASSMMLLPHERAVIERVFGTKVTDIYGCEEVGLIAGECERHEGLHLNVEQLMVEVLREDGTPADAGEPGYVVVTDLLNRAMPFIRYRMEDMAVLAVDRCSCGRAFPMLKQLVGRTADFLRRRDGSRVAGISLIENSLTRIPGIEQMQIVQPALLTIELRVVPGPGFAPERRRELLDYFRETFPGADVQLSDVTSIPAEPNGKYRFSICRVVD